MVARENDKALYTMLNCSADISWTAISIAGERRERHKESGVDDCVCAAQGMYVCCSTRNQQMCAGKVGSVAANACM
jgi:hypothetical protein